MSLSKKHYIILLASLLFYLAAQLFQQYVLRLGPMSSVSGLESAILHGPHPMNIARLLFVLLSMFAILVGYLILSCHFFKSSPLASVLSFVFFGFFCLFEIGYRSIELFQVVMVWGKEFSEAPAAIRASLMPRFQQFGEVVDAIYFPLLFSHLLGSICLMAASLKNQTGKLITLAMAINSVRLILRLFGFTPFGYLNIFSGAWYFPPVALILLILIVWTGKMMKMESTTAIG